MSCHPPVYQSALPHGADGHTAGVAREMNKSTEVSPIPQGASEYSRGSHMGKRERWRQIRLQALAGVNE